MCNFSITFGNNVSDLITKANTAITGAGGSFNGNEEAGSFDIKTFMGQIVGEYIISGAQINITITKKPMFVPCSEIENQLRKYLA